MKELKGIFPIDKAGCDITANYNVAPSQEILAIFKHEGENWLDKFHWGLVPFWAKDTSIGNRMINARAETVAEKPSFRNAFKKRRCMILADGFYEWKGEKGRKQPMFITLPDRKPFAFAGLWEVWNKKDDPDSTYRSCTILTTEASESIRDIHHRMPVILKPDVYEPWLNPENQEIVGLKNILAHGIQTELVSHPVSKQVNSVKNNDPSCIDPIA
ncbi:MAG: SOS response-associated peptidase [Desulfobacterales bacterium]|nr:MAG: SOS response-associated peptidase [Desulfobacterales bacterium]